MMGGLQETLMLSGEGAVTVKDCTGPGATCERERERGSQEQEEGGIKVYACALLVQCRHVHIHIVCYVNACNSECRLLCVHVSNGIEPPMH